jgi:hypothetical protein
MTLEEMIGQMPRSNATASPGEAARLRRLSLERRRRLSPTTARVGCDDPEYQHARQRGWDPYPVRRRGSRPQQPVRRSSTRNIARGRARRTWSGVSAATAEELAATGVHWNFFPRWPPQDIRWGRTYEAYSEDVEWVSALGRRTSAGGERPGRPAAVLATPHFKWRRGTAWGSAAAGQYAAPPQAPGPRWTSRSTAATPGDEAILRGSTPRPTSTFCGRARRSSAACSPVGAGEDARQPLLVDRRS